jgi:Glycosyl transferases group 1
MIKVIFGFADRFDELNTSYYRAIIPADQLKTAGYDVEAHSILSLFAKDDDTRVPQKIKDAVKNATHIVLERLLLSELHETITRWRTEGKKVFATFDDAYHLMPMGNESHRTWRGGKDTPIGKALGNTELSGAILGQFKTGLGLVDSALVPSRLLMDDYRSYCKQIEYVPNFPSLAMYGKPHPPKSPDVVVGWGGSSAHYISWRDSGLPVALGSLQRSKPRLRVHIQSTEPRLTSILDKYGLKCQQRNQVFFDRWPAIMSEFDIFVIPLAGEYDRRRSNLKALEAGLSRVPWIASDLEPYRDARGGIRVKNTPSAWRDALVALIEDEGLRDRLAEEGYAWSMEQTKACVATYRGVLGI